MKNKTLMESSHYSWVSVVGSLSGINFLRDTIQLFIACLHLSNRPLRFNVSDAGPAIVLSNNCVLGTQTSPFPEEEMETRGVELLAQSHTAENASE